ncbi:hypothetical protein BDR26DRAFT_885765 [Obelidium mucronatum]|nr:hypothetical protein BDR26DRAFT_885765 [Obelidium mucronatum]
MLNGIKDISEKQAYLLMVKLQQQVENDDEESETGARDGDSDGSVDDDVDSDQDSADDSGTESRTLLDSLTVTQLESRLIQEGIPEVEASNEVFSKDPNYTFCPLAHRPLIIKLLCKHFCRHSLLPERDGFFVDSRGIWEASVREIYNHCVVNNLREVWAYLWNEWYRWDRWCSWARASCTEEISVKRTTMIVESHWEKLKHTDLAHLNRPRLDRLIHVIITETIPQCLLRIPGSRFMNLRTVSLTSTQDRCKRAWKTLLSAKINGMYVTNINDWTCNCGSQKYSPHLLCKHLVLAATMKLTPNLPPTASNLEKFSAIPADMFKSLHLRRLKPFYLISGVNTQVHQPLHNQAVPLSLLADSEFEEGNQTGWISDTGEWETAESRQESFVIGDGFPSSEQESDLDPDDVDESLNVVAAKAHLKMNLQVALEALDSKSDDRFFRKMIGSAKQFSRWCDKFKKLRRQRGTVSTWGKNNDVFWGYRK